MNLLNLISRERVRRSASVVEQPVHRFGQRNEPAWRPDVIVWDIGDGEGAAEVERLTAAGVSLKDILFVTWRPTIEPIGVVQ